MSLFFNLRNLSYLIHFKGQLNPPKCLYMVRKREMWAENMISQPTFHLYLQVPYSTLSRYGLGSISDHKAYHTLPRTTRKRFQFLVRETKLF